MDIGDSLDGAGVGGGTFDGGDGDGDAGDGDGDAMGGLGGRPDKASGGSRAGDGGSDGAGGRAGTGGKPGTGGDDGTGGHLGTGGGPSTFDPLLFHDYEDGLVPGSVDSSNNAAVTVSKDNQFAGEFALLAYQPEKSDGSVSLGFDFPDGDYSKLYLRAFLYIEPGTFSGWVDLFEFQSTSGESLRFGLTSGGIIHVRLPSSDSAKSSDADLFEEGKWFCFRAEANLSNTGGTTSVAVGEATPFTTEEGDTLPGDGIVGFSYGILDSESEDGGLKIHFDNVTVDDAPLECADGPIVIDDPVESP